MKRITAIILTLLVVSCSKYNSEMDYQRQRIADMETAVFALNTSIEALRTVIDQLQQNDYVSDVIEIRDNGVLVGYTIVFSKGEKATLYFGEKGPAGEDGVDGKDGVTPIIGVKQYSDGLWYWTLNGSWLRGDDGKRIQVTGSDGATPTFKLVSDKWYISYDGGEHWTFLGSQLATSGVIVRRVVTTQDSVKLTLMDGTDIILPRGKSISIWQEGSFNQLFLYGETKKVRFSFSEGAEISWTIEEGWEMRPINKSSSTIEFEITAPDEVSNGTMFLIVSLDGAISTWQWTLQTITADLSEKETANCYIINKPGRYCFRAQYKGNSIRKMDYNWIDYVWYGSEDQSFYNWGCNSTYINGEYYCIVTIRGPLEEGNLLIANKDYNGKIMWSWHIWVTNYNPEEEYEVYKGHEDIKVMTRNLGATDGGRGMMYQWGRKDPFPNSTSNYSGTFESPTVSTFSKGSIDFASAHPTCFITPNSLNGDWYYTGEDYSYDNRWAAEKTMYDPCPPGWKVPVGGSDGLWSAFPDSSQFDGGKKTLVISEPFSTPSAKYILAGYKDEYSANIVADSSGFWTSTPFGTGDAYGVLFDSQGHFDKQATVSRARGMNVRCCKDDGHAEEPETDYDLSSKGAANCYQVRKSGDYSFRADVRGNGEETIEGGKSAVVLWESFGTNQRPAAGALVKNVNYQDGRISFTTPSPFKAGNAVIALKDAYGKILWSWHIWLCDFNPDMTASPFNGDVMMDRNLGATSATPGEVGTIGLAYQYGRKDPFMASSSFASYTEALSTNQSFWNTEYFYDRGHLLNDAYFYQNPMTVVRTDFGSIPAEHKYWFRSEKSMTDPCPYGWQLGSFDYNSSKIEWDCVNRGYMYDYKIWFPVCGYSYNFGFAFQCWRAFASIFDLPRYVCFYPTGTSSQGTSNYEDRFAVRCVKSSSSQSDEPVRHN